MATRMAIGMDIGGTNLRAAIVDSTGALTGFIQQPTANGSSDALHAQIVAVLAQFPRDLPTGIAIAGLIDAHGSVQASPNLSQLDFPLPLARHLAHALGRSVVVGNDASYAAVAEQHFGVGVGASSLVMVAIGTGIGVGVVLNGTLLTGAHGFAGEFGHTVLNALTTATDVRAETLETYLSGTGIAQRAKRPSEAVVALADAGDVAALALLKEVGQVLGVALANVVNLLDVAVCVIGGGAGVGLYPHICQPITDALGTHVLGGQTGRELPPVKRAQLGDTAGVIGAAVMAADRVRP